MKTLYFECFAGISGDMTIASLIDTGLVDVDKFLNELKKLNITGYKTDIGKISKNGIISSYFKVILENENHDYHHDNNHQEHEHENHHNHHEINSTKEMHNNSDHGYMHEHRNFKSIKTLIENSGIEDKAKEMAINVFSILAQAEGKIHGKDPMEVAFHEVGAIDSIIDIVGTSILINMIKPDKIVCSRLPLGGGFVKSMHGIIPVPAPATLEVLKNVPIYDNGIQKELVTPTGAAIVKALAVEFGPMPDMNIEHIGYGAGTREMDIPNVLRICVGSSPDKKKPVK